MPKFGWKPDTLAHINDCDVAGAVYRAERFGAARLASGSSFYDLMRFCAVRDQEETSACVGFGLTGAAYARLRSLGYDCGYFSPLASYSIGRQLEGIYKGKLLPDDGSYPSLVMSGGKRFGLVAESVWPFDRDHSSRVHQEVPFDVLQKASQFRLANFARIDAKGDARVEACKRAIASMHPVPLGMRVGSKFLNYAPGRDPVGVEFDDLGGHMTFLCGYEDDGNVFIGCNSWGTGYGEDGFYKITREKLCDESTTDLYDFMLTDQRAA
jgi:hypothetical protein